MPLYQILALVHAGVLLWLSSKLAKRLFEGVFTVILATAVFAWTNLVITSHLASTVRLLGQPFLYLLISAAVGAGLLHLFTWLKLGAPAADGVAFRPFIEEVRKDRIALLLLLFTGITTIFVLIISFSVLPNNWDTLAYRFPRAFFFVSSGALESPMRGGDPRIIFYPYNATLLYLFLAQYQLPAILWNLVTVAAWLLAGISACTFVLILGGTARAALTSAYLLLTAPVVLCLANSTNDELIAGAPLLGGVVFLIVWYRARSAAALYTAILILALGAASKLHWISLILHFIVYGIAALTLFRKDLVSVLRETVQPKALACVFLLMTPILFGFLATNYSGQGKLFNSDYQNGIINLPFNAEAATQSLYLYSAQVFLTPIVDHSMLMGKETAAKAFKSTNEATGAAMFRNVKQGAPYTHKFYTFRGLHHPDAAEYFEETMWLGMTPFLLLLGGVWFLLERPVTRAVAWMLLLAFPLWHLNFSALNRYLETASTYYAYVAPLAFACCGLLWDEWRVSPRAVWRYAAWLFPILLTSNTLMAGVMFMSNSRRNVSHAWKIKDGVTPIIPVEQPLPMLVEKAKRVYIPYMHWELMFWNVMRLNTAASYYTGDYKPELNYDLIVFPFAGNYTWEGLLPVRAPGLGELRSVGAMGVGDSVLMCSGPLCESECKQCEQFFSYPIGYQRKASQIEVFATGAPVHLRFDRTGFVRISVANQTTRQIASSAWVPVKDLHSFRQAFPDQAYDHMVFEVSCTADSECRQAVTVVPLRNGRHYLLDPQPLLDPALTQEVVDSVFGPKWIGTEGDGYWTFEWKLRPGTRFLDAQFWGKKGEAVTDQLEVIYVDGKKVALLRKGSNQIYFANWISAQPQIAKGTTSTDPTNIWTGRKATAGPVAANTAATRK